MDSNDEIEEKQEIVNEQDECKPESHTWKPCDGFCWDCERRTWCWASKTGEQNDFGN